MNESTGGAFPWRALGTGYPLVWDSSTNRVSCVTGGCGSDRTDRECN